MKLTQKVRYGVACLMELSKNYGDYVDAERMATEQNIPPAYAHKVLQRLSHAGMVIALKGVGYRLARPLEHITALEVMEALSETESEGLNPDAGQRLERSINRVLQTVTLAELVPAR